jgi:hypothetical protein
MARGSQATRPARPRGRRAPGGGRGARGGALAQGLRSSAPSRYLLARPTLSAGLLLGAFVLVYLWPVLLGGKLLTPNALLYGVTPWQRFAPDDLRAYANGLLSDVPTADYPWRFLVRQMLHDGTFPSWNPYVFGGIPLYSNPQTGLFSLFSLPLWILPLDYGIGVGAALKLWAAGFGTYLLVRELRLGFLPGLLAGVCFSFSAIDIVWLTHETLPAVAALLPSMLWLVERIYQGGRLGSLLGLAAATAIGIGGGHPGMQVHLVAAVATYAVLRAAFLPRSSELRERLRPLGLAAGGLALGALLMGFMLVPEALSSRDTIGTLARSHGSGTLPGTQMPFTTIRTVLFPDWWGRPSSIELGAPVTELARNVLVGVNYNERTFYAGAVGLLLALAGVAAAGRWRRKGPFVVLAVLGLAIPLHTPGLYQLVTHLPAFELVQNQRLHFVWAMGMAVLAAFGLQALLDSPAGDRRRLAVGASGVLLGVAALASVLARVDGTVVSRTLEHFASGRSFNSLPVIQLTSAVWYLALALAVGLALLAARRWPQRRWWIAGGVVALAAADMLHFADGYQPMTPRSRLLPVTKSIAYLQRHRDEGRMMGIGVALPNDWTLTYGLHDVRGYDPPQPSLRYYRLWRAAEPEQLDWLAFAMKSLSPTTLQVASVLGARYLIADPGVERPEGSEPPQRALRVAYDGRDARVFVNERAAPRALAGPAVQVTSGEAETRAVLVEPGFDPRREVVVERAEREAAALAEQGVGVGPVTGPAGRVTVADPSNARVLLHATLPRRGLVVLNDGWAPGWSVRVDGRAADPVRVNDVMRGVVVGAGAHEVEWRYRVPGLRAGVALTLLALLIVGACLVARRAASRRGRVGGRPLAG